MKQYSKAPKMCCPFHRKKCRYYKCGSYCGLATPYKSCADYAELARKLSIYYFPCKGGHITVQKNEELHGLR